MHRSRSAGRPTGAPIGPGHGGFVEAGPSAPRHGRSARSADLALRPLPPTTAAGVSMTVRDPADDGSFHTFAPCIPNPRFGRRGSRACKTRRATRWRAHALTPLLRRLRLRHAGSRACAGSDRTVRPPPRWEPLRSEVWQAPPEHWQPPVRYSAGRRSKPKSFQGAGGERAGTRTQDPLIKRQR
jgi:hypothetical protein